MFFNSISENTQDAATEVVPDGYTLLVRNNTTGKIEQRLPNSPTSAAGGLAYKFFQTNGAPQTNYDTGFDISASTTLVYLNSIKLIKGTNPATATPNDPKYYTINSGNTSIDLETNANYGDLLEIYYTK